MTKKEFMDYLTERCIGYLPLCRDSIVRNNHMNNIGYESSLQVTDNEIEAILADFINYIGIDQGLDWGLYTHYLHEKE